MFARGKDWTRFVPIVAVARSYRVGDFRHDLLAGVTVGVVTVPQAVAYAFLAGLPAQAGLYACLAPMMIYAMLGSSRQLVVGPVAVAALMVAATVGAHAPAYSDAWLAITSVLCLQAGLALWGLRTLQLAGIVNVLSQPVVAGFVNAAAVLIVLSQLPAFAGLGLAVGGNPLEPLARLVAQAALLNPLALSIGFASLAALWLAPRVAKAWSGRDDHPLGRSGPLVVAVCATGAVGAFGLEVQTIGFVPAGLPTFTLPLFDFRLWLDLAPSAAAIALVAYVETFGIGTTLAARAQQRVDPGQELIALGAANVGAALTGASPVAGSFSRSSVNHAAGARTPVSALVGAAAIVVTLLWLTPLFEHLPNAALAAIVMASVAGLLDVSMLREQWRFHREDVFVQLATFAGVMGWGVERGLLLGVAVAVVLFVARSGRPHIAVVGRLGDSAHFRNVDRYATRTVPNVVAVRVDENLHFANASQVEARILEIAGQHKQTLHLVLMCSAINFIDASGLSTLRRANHALRAQGIVLHVSDAKGAVRDQFAAINLAQELSGNVYGTMDEAMGELAAASANSAAKAV